MKYETLKAKRGAGEGGDARLARSTFFGTEKSKRGAIFCTAFCVLEIGRWKRESCAYSAAVATHGTLGEFFLQDLGSIRFFDSASARRLAVECRGSIDRHSASWKCKRRGLPSPDLVICFSLIAVQTKKVQRAEKSSEEVQSWSKGW